MMTNTFASQAVWFHVHVIFAVVAIVGVIFLVVWALKNLKKDGLLGASIILIILGIIGILMTAPAASVMFKTMLSVCK